MASENNTDNFSALDSLGPQFGGINRPNIDIQSYKPFEGDRISMPEINFPTAGNYNSPIPSFDSIDRPNLSIEKNIVRPKGKTPRFEDIQSSLHDYGKSILQSNQDQNQYAKMYSYNAGSSGNSYYKRYAAYGQKKFDEIGFTPLRDNEAVFNERTTGWNDFTRMMQYSFFPLAWQGFKSAPKSLFKLLQGDLSGDTEDARLYEEAAGIGQSTKGGVGGFMNNALMNFGYTAGIMTEAVAEFAAEALITGVTGGTTGGVLAARTAANLQRIGKGFSKFTMLDKGGDLFRSSLQALGNSQNARNFYKAANSKVGQFFNPLTNTFEAVADVYKIGKFDNLSGLAALSKTAGGFYRDVKGINLALAEARLEGGMVQNSVYDSLYDKYYEKNGKAPSNEIQKAFEQQAKAASAETIAWNTALIYGSNKITFPNIINPKGGAGKFLRNATEDILEFKNAGKVVFQKAKDAAGKLTKGEFKYLDGSFKTYMETLKDVGFKTATKDFAIKGIKGSVGYFKSNVTEGIQENLQETIAGAMEGYYTDAFNNPAVRSYLYAQGSTTNAMRDKYSYFADKWAEENPFTEKGFETFASGFVMGMFAKPLNKSVEWLSLGYNKIFDAEAFEDYKEKKANYGKQVAAQLNALYSDPKQFFDSKIFNYATQNKIADIRNSGNKKQTLDAEDHALVSAVTSALQTNSIGFFRDNIAAVKEMTPEEIETEFGLEKGKGVEYQQRVDEVLTRVDKISERYEQMESRYPNPVDLSGYEKGTDAYKKAAIFSSAWDVAKANAIFMNESYDNARKRMDSIERTIRSQKPLSKMTDSEVQVLFNPSRLKNEAELLQSELDSQRDTLSPDEISKRERKIEAVKELKKAYDYYFKYNVIDKEAQIEKMRSQGLFDNQVDDEGNAIDPKELEAEARAEIDRQLRVKSKSEENTTRAEADLEVAYKEYLRSIANLNDEDYFDSKAEEAFELLMDNYRLGREANTLSSYVNMLHNPKSFTEHVERNYTWMQKLYDNRKDYYENLINQEIDLRELNTLLNKLADKNIFISADDAYEFQRNGTFPNEFFDATRKAVIREGHPDYDEYIDLFDKALRLKMQDPRTYARTLDDMLNAELINLDVELSREIEALPKSERVTKKGKLQLKNNLATIEELSEQLADGDYIDAKLVQGKDVSEITVYKDGNVLKLGDKNGEEITIDEFNGGFTSGDIYRVELKPDPVEVKKLENQYSERKQDVIRLNIQKLEDDVQLQQNEYVRFTVNSPYESMDPELQERLSNAFNSYIETDEKLIEQVSEMEDVEILNMLDDFIKTNKVAANIIEEYNIEKLDEAAQRLAEANGAPEIEFEGQTYDLETMDLSEVKDLAKKLKSQYDRLNKKPNSEKTNEEKETALRVKFTLDLVQRYITKNAEAEAIAKEETSSEETPVEEPQAEPAQSVEGINKDIKARRERAKKALAKRVALLTEKKNRLASDESAIKDTLKHLQELLDNSVELTGVQLEAAMGDAQQVTEMIKAIVDFKYKNRPKTRILKRDIKAQVEREFEFAKNTLAKIAELKADLKVVEANKKDLTNQINYYNNMIADPNLSILTRADIRQKISKLEKKLTTVEKLISILKNAISKSVAYLKEYLNVWNSRYKTMTDFQKKTGFKILSKDELGALIKSTNANSIAKADSYAGLKAQYDSLEQAVLETIDDVEFLEKVQDQERTRLSQLEAAADKYYDQIRYLYELLDDVAEDIVAKNTLEGATPGSPKAEATAATSEDFSGVTDVTDKTAPVATYSFVDAAETADLDDIVGPPSDIEAKKADIERRRQEELNKTFDNNKGALESQIENAVKSKGWAINNVLFHGGPKFDKFKREFFQTGEYSNVDMRRVAQSMGVRIPEGSFSFSATPMTAINYALTYGKNNPTLYIVNNTKAINAEELTGNAEKDAQEWIIDGDNISDIITVPLIPNADKINAKYDAELAALEESTQEGIQVVTEINPELRSMLNQMGYKNKTIDALPKSILERIVKEGIPSEEYGSRVITKSLASQAAWATQATPVTITSIEKGGVKLQKVNGTETIFLTFDQLENSTVEKQKLPTMKDTETVVEVTPEVKEFLSKGTNAASAYAKTDIDNLEETVKNSKLEGLENDLFNLEICE